MILSMMINVMLNFTYQMKSMKNTLEVLVMKIIYNRRLDADGLKTAPAGQARRYAAFLWVQ